ncbi:MAG: acyl-CoA dehydrogenase family protein [Pseudomonadota bacterium]
MNFGFTEEQDLLRDQVRRFLNEHASSEAVRTIMHTEAGYDAGHWQHMASLGWLGLVVPPAHGGVGMGWVDLIVLLEEMGRSLYPSPFISSTLAAATISELGSPAQQKQLLPGLATGTRIGTLAVLDDVSAPVAGNVTLAASKQGNSILLSGTKPFVQDAGAADLFLVGCRIDGELFLALVEKASEGVSATSSPTMDRTKRTGSLQLENVSLQDSQLIPMTEAALARIFDKACVAVTAEMVGAAEAVLNMTTAYANERIQFDNPIGKYQGVKHRLAEMYVDVESFKSLLYYAAWTVDEQPDSLPRSASLAKAYASEAFAGIGINGVQLHGAIGFTAEYDVQLYLKRSKWARPMFGDADYHYERVALIGAY